MQAKQFSKAFEDRLADIKKALQVQRPEDQADYLKKLQQQIHELKELVPSTDQTKDFELEFGADASCKPLIKECNSKIRQSKHDYSEKESQLSMLQYKDLMAADVDDEAGQDEKSAGLVRQKRMLEEGRRNLGLATEYSSNIGTELSRQKEKLQKSLSTVLSADPDQRDDGRPRRLDFAAGLAGGDPEKEPTDLLRSLRLRSSGDSLLHPPLTTVSSVVLPEVCLSAKKMVLMRLELMTLELLAPRSNLLS